MATNVQFALSDSSGCEGVTVVTISGELTSASIDEITAFFSSIVEDHPPYIIAEMSNVSSFSSSALGSFMGSRQRFVEREGDLVFAGLTLDLKSKLSLLGAHKIFQVFPDVRSALVAYTYEKKGHSQMVTLSFPSQLRYVPSIRQMISRIALQKGYSSRDAFRIETIVDEVCNNAVEHGAQSSEHNIDLSVGIDSKKIEIKVINLSNPEKIEALKELASTVSSEAVSDMANKRGRGLALIKMLSNDLTIDISNGGTSVHVVRRKGD